VKPLETISNLINSLSNDEDIRQDLWIHYLSGTPVESLDARLSRIKADYTEDLQLQQAIWDLIQNPPSEELSTLIQSNFTDYERSIICCLMLGCDSSKISEIKGISQVRIRQSIATIRYNKCWEEAYGTKEKPDRRRKIRT
jgi:hypothetical protein